MLNTTHLNRPVQFAYNGSRNAVVFKQPENIDELLDRREQIPMLQEANRLLKMADSMKAEIENTGKCVHQEFNDFDLDGDGEKDEAAALYKPRQLHVKTYDRSMSFVFHTSADDKTETIVLEQNGQKTTLELNNNRGIITFLAEAPNLKSS